jgi:hypothetical protein
VHAQPIGSELGAQSSSQIAIDLDDGEPLDPLQKWPRQRTKPGTDFDHVVVGRRIDCGDDAVDVVAIDEEILAKTLARRVAGRSHMRVRRGP